MTTQGSSALRGKVAFVTGASGGLGRRFALQLASHGAKVAIGARRVDALEKVAAEIRAVGGEAYSTVLDVRREESIIEAIVATERNLGPIDLLVNNSGVSVVKPVLEQTAEDFDAVMSVNLRGAFLVAQHIARRMRDAGRAGSIINIASILGERQIGFVLPYAVSKAGVIQMTKCLALELARYSIRVNAIAPGYILTDINKDFFATPAGEAMTKRIPQRRVGAEADLDGALLFLASEASKFMTGSVITVDGGHSVASL